MELLGDLTNPVKNALVSRITGYSAPTKPIVLTAANCSLVVSDHLEINAVEISHMIWLTFLRHLCKLPIETNCKTKHWDVVSTSQIDQSTPNTRGINTSNSHNTTNSTSVSYICSKINNKIPNSHIKSIILYTSKKNILSSFKTYWNWIQRKVSLPKTSRNGLSLSFIEIYITWAQKEATLQFSINLRNSWRTMISPNMAPKSGP